MGGRRRPRRLSSGGAARRGRGPPCRGRRDPNLALIARPYCSLSTGSSGVSERRRVWLNAHVSTTPYPRKVHACLSGVGYFCDPATRPRRCPVCRVVSSVTRVPSWCVLGVCLQCSVSVLPIDRLQVHSYVIQLWQLCTRGVRAMQRPISGSRDTPPCAQLPTLGHLSDPRGHVGKGPLSEVGFISSCFPAASPSRARPRGALIADSISKLLRRTYPYSLPSPVSLPVSSPVSLLYPAAAPQQLFSRARLWFLI